MSTRTLESHEFHIWPESKLEPVVPDNLPATPGTYALIFRLPQSLRLTVGALGLCELPPGVYIYVGSACGAGGLRARVRRHFRAEKRLHWHIDYLTAAITAPVEVIWDASGLRRECEWVRRLLAETGAVAPVPGFGSSDCTGRPVRGLRCPAHLLRLVGVDDLAHVRAALSSKIPVQGTAAG